MNVLLVNAPMLYVGEFQRANSSLQMHFVYSYLRQNGVEVEVLDPNLDLGPARGDMQSYLPRLRAYFGTREFTAAGVSCPTSYHYLGALAVGHALRALRPEAPLAVGGVHATALPDDFLEAATPFDFVVRGPGEENMLRIAHAGRRPERPVCEEGIAVPLAATCRDWSYPYADGSTYLSRGCPHRCIYCTKKWTSYECLGVEQALAEYTAAARHAADGFVHVQDPCFGVDKHWRRRFLRALIELRLGPRPDLELRIDQLEAEDVELLGAARARVYFGVEAGAATTLRLMRKTTDPERYLAACPDVLALCNRFGVEHIIGVLYNHPGETAALLEESVEFFWRLFADANTDSLLCFRLHTFAYYPGSPFDSVSADFRDRYGTQIHFPTWWREEAMEHRDKSEAVSASADLSRERADELVQRLRVANWMLGGRVRARAEAASTAATASER